MRVLSFDVGSRNLAMCYVDGDTSLVPVTWKLFDLKMGVRANTVLIQDLVKNMQTLFDACSTIQQLPNDTHIVIEAQEVSNVLMRILSYCIQMYFNCRNHVVRFKNGQFKYGSRIAAIDDDTRKQMKRQYSLRKRIAIHTVERICEQLEFKPTMYSDWKSKKDDLADAYLQAIAYLEICQ